MRYDFLSSMILKQLVGYFALVFIALISERAEALSSDWFETKQTKVRIIAGPTTLDNKNEIWLGLHFIMQPGSRGFSLSLKFMSCVTKFIVGDSNLDRQLD